MGDYFVPYHKCQVAKYLQKDRTWIVRSAGNCVFKVQSYPSISVDIRKRICSCYQWQLNGFSCAHAAQAVQKSGEKIYDCIEDYFHTHYYKSSYSQNIYPVPTVGIQDYPTDGDVILPPSLKKQLGRPKKKRIRSRGEKTTQIRCGRCNKLGNHNKKTYKESL
ncbi:hypothetical protein L1049_020800 [Liquidambar formosana]|uniref:SWIM-type domain-containing protein n=1 Tax=Liquidambar formosana TaxID=63359 RepID=A0AAP0SDL4_LIQFO